MASLELVWVGVWFTIVHPLPVPGQSVVRMHQKVRWLVRTYAARKFQAAWRQTIARDRFIVAKDGMILLQAVARGRRGRKIVRALHQAAALIQATYRMHEIRDAVSTLGGNAYAYACVCCVVVLSTTACNACAACAWTVALCVRLLLGCLSWKSGRYTS